MKTINDIVQLSQKYIDSHNDQSRRFKDWQTYTYPIVKSTLNKIVNEIKSKNDYFKSNLYLVDDNSSNRVCIKSGNMPIPTTDRQIEYGFQVHFAPLPNGKIHVSIYNHSINQEASEYQTIEIIEDNKILTEDKIFEIVYNCLDKVYKSSYLFIGD